MGGLETSIINFKGVFVHDSARFDSEYYQTEYVDNDQKIAKNSVLLSTLVKSMSGGATPLGAMYPTTGVPFLRVQNIMPNYISSTGLVYLDEQQNQKIARSQLQKNDVLLTITGAFGKSAIVNDEFVGANINQHSVKMTVQDIMPHYLSVFFNCKYGYSQSQRNVVGITRPALGYQSIEKFSIFMASLGFQKRITQLCVNADKSRAKSQSQYAQAEKTLLAKMDLGSYEGERLAISIKTLQESFGHSDRLDAEYYHPKFDHVLSAIKKQSNRALDSIVDIKKSVEPGSDVYCDDGVPFVRVADLNKHGITTPTIHIDKHTFSKWALQGLYPRQDTILLSKDGTVGIAYKVQKDLSLITSGAVLHLMVRYPETVLPDYLALVLNSLPVQAQAERDSGGAIIQHWRLDDIKSTRIPILPISIQRQIVDRVKQSFACLAEAERLLQIAKQAVEIAIEDGENKAVKFIEEGGYP